MRKKWTPEEDQIIIDARNAGLQYKQIVPLLPDRNLRTISVRGASICPTKSLKPWTEEETLKFLDLVAENLSYEEIAKVLDRTYIAVKSKGSVCIKEGLMEYRERAGRTYSPAKEPERKNFSDLNQDEYNFVETGQYFFKFD